MKNVKTLGQVFTPNRIVKRMIDLITIEKPKILEPSSGDGAFYNQLINKYTDVKGIEFDKTVAHKGATVMNFFDDFDKYDVIIGNPPYVDHKEIKCSTPKHKPANLYLLFLEKSLNQLKDNGELIFIMPTTWLTSTSASALTTKINNDFSIQYFEVVNENVWDNAAVTTAIVKIKKGNNHKKLPYYMTSNNKIIMGKRGSLSYKGNITIKVGAVSGNNKKYKKSGKGSSLFIDSSTERTGKRVNMIYKQDEWTRKVPTPPIFTYQIFVNAKTRKDKPFYMLEQRMCEQFLYDGAVICIYSDMSLQETKEIMNKLNNLDWKAMGIYTNGKHNFTQSILKGVLNE